MNRASLLIVFLLLLGFSSAAKYENCSEKLSVLEHALYETEDNERELNRAFFPPRKTTSRQINITYIFLDETGSDDGCRVNYIWAVGGFLLIQPPTIFRFTSLHFSYPANEDEIKNITIKLPSECRMLVNDTGNCSCYSSTSTTNNLDILTQQIKQYSKYNSPEQVVRDDLSAAQAVCDENLKSKYFEGSKVHLYLGVTLVLPFIVMVVIGIFLRGNHKEIEAQLAKPSNHHNLAGVVLTGLHVMLFVIAMDCVAVHYYKHSRHEYMKYEVGGTFNLNILYGTLVLDLLMMFYPILQTIYRCICCCVQICHKDNIGKQKEDKELENILYIPYFYTILENKKTNSRRDQWFILNLMYPPLFSVTSHIGYILIAWLTEPVKTTSVAILAISIVIFLFLTFRSLYMSNIELNCSTCRNCNNCGTFFFMIFFPLLFAFLPFTQLFAITVKGVKSCCCENDDNNNRTNNDRNTDEFNVFAFIVAGLWGIFLVGSVALVVSAFFIIPVPTVLLAGYLENIIQIFLVVLAALVSYKIFSINESDLSKFLKSFKDTYGHVQIEETGIVIHRATFPEGLFYITTAKNTKVKLGDETVELPEGRAKVTLTDPQDYTGHTITVSALEDGHAVTIPTPGTVCIPANGAKLHVTITRTVAANQTVSLSITRLGPHDGTRNIIKHHWLPAQPAGDVTANLTIKKIAGNNEAVTGNLHVSVGKKLNGDEFISAGVIAGKVALKLAR